MSGVGSWRRVAGGGHPARDVLLYVPALVGFVFGVWFGVAVAAERAAGSVTLAVFIVLVCLVAVSLSWPFWAALVVSAVWLIVPERKTPALRPAPLSNVATSAIPDVVARVQRVLAKYDEHRVGIAGCLVVLIGILDVVVVGPPLAPEAVASDLFRRLVLALVAALGVTVALWALRQAIERSVVAVARWRSESARRSAGMEAPERWAGPPRESVEGAAAPLDGGYVVAPLSGRRCLAFRLVGRIGGVALDDSDAAAFKVLEGEREVAVRGETFAAALSTPSPEPVELDDAERERLIAFSNARGLPTDGLEDAELAERCLVDGDRVAVHGAAGREAGPSARAYRAAESRPVLDDSDGEPVLIVA